MKNLYVDNTIKLSGSLVSTDKIIPLQTITIQSYYNKLFVVENDKLQIDTNPPVSRSFVSVTEKYKFFC